MGMRMRNPLQGSPETKENEHSLPWKRQEAEDANIQKPLIFTAQGKVPVEQAN